jgi:tRNA modification GTPase
LYRADTIVARATAAGRAAIAIVRFSGPDAARIAGRLLRSEHPLVNLPPWRLGRFSAIDPEDGHVVDDVLAVRMRAPRSYTGEEVVEIHCHGSSVVVDTLIGAAILAGARLAEAGEFTRRAVLNGRMDLIQAEAVADLIEAPVLSGAKAAWRRLSGSLSGEIVELRARLVSVLADIEAHIDFSDDDLPDEDSTERVRLIDAVRRALENLLGRFVAARRERDGYRVVLAGKPNVGKSSLLNGLLGFDRAIVSAEAGTTRDAIMETVDLRGFGLVITDTAGVRATASASESVAVTRSLREAATADILVRVFDGSHPLDDADLSILQLQCDEGAAICVINKSDLTPGLTVDDRRQLEEGGCPVVPASAVAINGCDALKSTLTEVAHALKGDAGESAGLARERHWAALQRALAAVHGARSLMAIGDQAELASIEVRRAIAEIAAITEVLDNEEVLDSIFASFCIGK